MRVTVATLLVGLLAVAGCKNAEEEGARAADEAAKQQEQASPAKPAAKVLPPVPGGARVPCAQLIDPVAFTTRLTEAEPLTVKDVTGGNAEAAASCTLVRGGKRLSRAEQDALLKKQRRLGVLAGDDVCSVAAFCWTIEKEEKFKEKCKATGNRDDESMGSYACVQTVQQGAEDVNVYRFLDADTKCILEVRGGASMVDNNVILECAKAARDLIGPDQIKVDGSAPAPAAEPAAAEPGAPAPG